MGHCLTRKRVLRILSRYRIATTIIDRVDNRESCTDKGAECRPSVTYNERNSQFARVFHFFKSFLKFWQAIIVTVDFTEFVFGKLGSFFRLILHVSLRITDSFINRQL